MWRLLLHARIKPQQPQLTTLQRCAAGRLACGLHEAVERHLCGRQAGMQAGRQAGRGRDAEYATRAARRRQQGRRCVRTGRLLGGLVDACCCQGCPGAVGWPAITSDGRSSLTCPWGVEKCMVASGTCGSPPSCAHRGAWRRACCVSVCTPRAPAHSTAQRAQPQRTKISWGAEEVPVRGPVAAHRGSACTQEAAMQHAALGNSMQRAETLTA